MFTRRRAILSPVFLDNNAAVTSALRTALATALGQVWSYLTPAAPWRWTVARRWRGPGNIVNAGVNERILSNVKHTWANIRKIADATRTSAAVSYTSWEVEL